jgi:hypothetical protein
MSKKHTELIKMTKVLQGLVLQCMSEGKIHPDVLKELVTVIDAVDDAIIELGERLTIDEYQAYAMLWLTNALVDNESVSLADRQTAAELSDQIERGLFGSVAFIDIERGLVN